MFVESMLSKNIKRLRTVGPQSGVYPYRTFISLVTYPFGRLSMSSVTFIESNLYQILLFNSFVVEAVVNERESSLRFREEKVRHLCALFGKHICTFVGYYCQKCRRKLIAFEKGTSRRYAREWRKQLEQGARSGSLRPSKLTIYKINNRVINK